jgi:hypothetical protein
MPKIFEGEAEYQRWLAERGLVEAHAGVLHQTAQERRRVGGRLVGCPAIKGIF